MNNVIYHCSRHLSLSGKKKPHHKCCMVPTIKMYGKYMKVLRLYMAFHGSVADCCCETQQKGADLQGTGAEGASGIPIVVSSS